MDTKTLVDLTGLGIYDGLIKQYISDADAKSFKSAKFDTATRVLSLYKVEVVGDSTVADFTVEIPETDISNLLEKIAGGTAGNIVVVGENGVVVDAGVALDTLATKSEVEAVDDKIDAVSASIGTVPEGQTVMGIVKNIQENAYDDTELRGLIDDNAEAIEAHKTAIDSTVTTLVGDDTNKSVRTIANEELAAQLIGENAQESLDTLEEIAKWIQDHPDDASAMNKAIEDLEALVGTIPEGVTATTIVGYIAEVKAVAEAAVKEIKTGNTNGTISVDGTDVAVAGLGTAAYKDETAFDSAGSASAAQTNAQTYADGLNTAMDSRVADLETKVGDGYTVITEAEIQALFA